MRKIVFMIIFALSFFTCYCEKVEITQSFTFTSDNKLYKEIENHFQGITIGYIKGNYEFESLGSYFTIDRINIYAQKNKSNILLGFITKDGIYNKNSVMIKQCPFIDSKDVTNIGLCSSMLEDPFSPVIVVNRKGKLGFLDPYGIIEIDFANDSLIFKSFQY